MRRIAPLLVVLLAACPRQPAAPPDAIDCADFGRPELGVIEPLDCGFFAARQVPLLAQEEVGEEVRPRVPTANHDPVVAAAGLRVAELQQEVLDRCLERNRCTGSEASFRAASARAADEAAQLRTAAERAEGAAERRQLALRLGLPWPAPCPSGWAQSCDDGTCAPEQARCCGDGTSCSAGGPCCQGSCCPAGTVCGPGGSCQPAPRCRGAWPVACPDGTCAPAGATCCGDGRFCRTGSCCGAAGCCTEFEACVAGRCVPGARGVCTDPARPVACADGGCAPLGGSCCGEGRICPSGTCCGAGGCCQAGEICADGACLAPATQNPRCTGGWPLTCADGSCAPAGAACCGEGRFCQAGSQCCGATCCLPGEICTEDGCLSP